MAARNWKNSAGRLVRDDDELVYELYSRKRRRRVRGLLITGREEGASLLGLALRMVEAELLGRDQIADEDFDGEVLEGFMLSNSQDWRKWEMPTGKLTQVSPISRNSAVCRRRVSPSLPTAFNSW